MDGLLHRLEAGRRTVKRRADVESRRGSNLIVGTDTEKETRSEEREEVVREKGTTAEK